MRLLLALAAALVLVVGGLLFFILWSGLRDDLRPVDVAVVLGNHVTGDGRPSPRLAARLDRTVELYRDGLFQTIIVSGGVSSSGVDEAPVMAAYLDAAGVPPSAIVLDHAGANTAATTHNAADWMRRNNAATVMAISQYFHMARIALSFRHNGVEGIAHARAPYFGWRDLYSIPREIAALVSYAIGRR